MSSRQTPSPQLPLGAVALPQLSDARLQCHHAAQLVAALGISLLPRRDDDSHANLGWEPDLGALTSHPVPGTSPFRGGLVIAELELAVLGNGAPSRFGLDGQTVADGWRWLLEEVKRHGGDVKRMSNIKHYSIPSHPVAAGAAFQRKPASAYVELAAYYALADRVLRALVARTPGASDVRCWPHHFDLATLIALRGGATVGAGLSPGDDSYGEPYFYVTPYPYPAADRLEKLPLGHWHTMGWTGAVLTGSEMFSRPGDQEQAVTEFMDAAVAACQSALRS